LNSIFQVLSSLCCPALTPQIVGAVVVDPPTVKVSVQVPIVVPVVDGPPMVKDTKSRLTFKKTDNANNFYITCLNFILLLQCIVRKYNGLTEFGKWVFLTVPPI
jgi:hypothetical protein